MGKKALCFLSAVFMSLALAQGYAGQVVTQYDLRMISSRPGVIYVSPYFTTVVEFSELMDEISTSRPSLFQIKVAQSENMLFLKALKEAGSADLVVRVAGYVALFKIVVDPKMEVPRRYVVTLRTRTEAPASTLPNTSVQNQPSNSGAQNQARATNPTPPPASKTGSEETGGQKTDTAPKSTTSVPSWLKVEFTPTQMGNGWFVQYRIQNNGSEPLSLKAEDLTVIRNGVSLPFRLVRTTFGASIDFLAPNEEATGVIVVEDSPESISWAWTLKTKSTSYTLQGKGE